MEDKQESQLNQQNSVNIGNADELTVEELRFCQYVDEGMSATQAVLKAYEKISDYNYASLMGHRLIRSDKIRNYRKEQKREIIEQYGLSIESLLAELISLANSNVKDFLETDNNVKDISKMPRALTAAIEYIQTNVHHDGGDSDGFTIKTKFKLYNKLDAIEKLAKHLGLYEKDNEQKTKGLQSFADLVRKAATCTEQPKQ